MYTVEGNKSHDVSDWSRTVEFHYSSLYKYRLENAEQKLERLHSLESACLRDHQAGSHKWIDLHISVLLDTRHKMGKGKASGPDGVVYEMLSYFDLDALETIRTAFESRFNCLPGSTACVDDWLRITVFNIPKSAHAHKIANWRPLSLTCALSKWYLSCLCHVLKEHAAKPTCDQYGFNPGCQPMQVTEMTRMVLERASEWNLPVWVFKGDVSRAFDNMEHPV
eukprot:1278474-Heterocapsa_arctica.AAC.1